MTCPTCNGTKHVMVSPGRYTRCRCVQTSVIHTRYRRAGVPQTLWGHPLETIVTGSLFHWAGIKLPLLPDATLLAWVHVRDLSKLRRWTLTHALRGYLDTGHEAQRLHIREVVDAQFDRDMRPAIDLAVRTYPCLVLELDNETNNKMVPQVLHQVFSHRATMRGLTVLASTDDIGIMPVRYGRGISAVMAGRKGITYLGPRLPPAGLSGTKDGEQD